jgi:hypothetical protein
VVRFKTELWQTSDGSPAMLRWCTGAALGRKGGGENGGEVELDTAHLVRLLALAGEASRELVVLSGSGSIRC